MPRSLPSLFVLILVLAVSMMGVRRLSFATDILEILPQDIPEVQALKNFRKHFDDDYKVILLLRHDEEIYEEDVEDFCTFLGEELPSGRVEFRSRFEDDPASFAPSLARMWADSDPEQAAELADQLMDPAALTRLVQESKDKIELSLDQGEATIASYDPIGFLSHPAMEQLKGIEFNYQSEDGKMWLVTIGKSDLGLGYQDHSKWVNKIRAAADQWSGEGFTYSLTGGPVRSAEIGQGMEDDMAGTILMTSVIVGLLFLLIQRSLIQFFVLSVILVLVFFITLGMAGWIFGTLNLVSVGFAAILLGLVIDYAVVIAREAEVGHSAREMRRAMAPGILWAALTTAVVFGLLMLSSFVGMQQLGGVILIGLIVGAMVCLWVMPWALAKFPPKRTGSWVNAPFPRAKVGAIALTMCWVVAVGVFGFKGAPEISFNVSMVEMNVSESSETFAIIQEQYPAWSKKNISISTCGESLTEVRESIEFAEEQIEILKKEGLIVSSEWPVEILPDLAARAANAAQWKEVSEKSEEIVATLKEAGFSEKGYELDRLVLAHLAATPDELDPFVRIFYHHKGCFAGRVQLKDPVTEESAKKLAVLHEKGVMASGWQFLQISLLPKVKEDFFFLFIPATVVLLGALIIVFRSLRDAALTALVLVTVLVLINALSVLCGRPWNFLSSLAIPLIVGTGIDYSIHLIFALRRSEGDCSKVWNGVGKAICFCGLSTVVGFGSLAFASNQMLQSMGILCGAGVFLTMVLSMLVVPGLWCFFHRKD